MSQSQIPSIAIAAPIDLLRADLNIVVAALKETQRRLELATGGKHTWINPALAIATSRANDPLPEYAQLEADNTKLVDAIFGKTGVASGLEILERNLATSLKADHKDAPFPLDANQAKQWHHATAGAYQHALEMVCIDPSLKHLSEKYAPAVEATNEDEETIGMSPA